MTERPDIRLTLRRLAWMCSELAAGNNFSPEQLAQWRADAWYWVEELDRQQDQGRTLIFAALSNQSGG